MPMNVAVIGAGISGLTCAGVLRDSGHEVRVYDKARGPGGRMSTRRADERRFDHGAQYFTVRDSRFEQFLAPLMEDRIVAPWEGRVADLDRGVVSPKGDDTTRFVGVPGMNALCRYLARGTRILFNTRVTHLAREGARWRVHAGEDRDLGSFDAVVVSAPAPQAAELLATAAPEMAARAASAPMSACWAVMAEFSHALDVQFDAAFVHESPLSWIARNGSKPGRPDHEAWVLHGSPAWSESHVDLERTDAGERLVEALREALGGQAFETVHLAAHRWLYALPTEPLTESCLFDPELALAACGDWCGGPRVEGAFLSGLAAAGCIDMPTSVDA